MTDLAPTQPRPSFVIPAFASVIIGFAIGYLVGTHSTKPEATESLPHDVQRKQQQEHNDTTRLLAEAADRDKAGIVAMLAGSSDDQRQCTLLALLSAEDDPRAALAFLKEKAAAGDGALYVGACESIFRIWAANGPDDPIAALQDIADRELRKHAIHGTLARKSHREKTLGVANS